MKTEEVSQLLERGANIARCDADPDGAPSVEDGIRYFRAFAEAAVGMSQDNQLRLARIRMPFGKYKGLPFSQIPLIYLDETICVMPPTYIVRRAIEFVDLVQHENRLEWRKSLAAQSRWLVDVIKERHLDPVDFGL